MKIDRTLKNITLDGAEVTDLSSALGHRAQVLRQAGHVAAADALDTVDAWFIDLALDADVTIKYSVGTDRRDQHHAHVADDVDGLYMSALTAVTAAYCLSHEACQHDEAGATINAAPLQALAALLAFLVTDSTERSASGLFLTTVGRRS